MGALVQRSRCVVISTALVVAVSVAVVGVAPAANAAGSVSIDAPAAPSAGTVRLTGNAGPGAGGVTSVVYVLDASDSSATSVGSDCSGNGASGPEDDFNGDGRVGDVLDCEIAGVIALNNSVAATPGVQVGLVALAARAAAADLDPVGSASFVAPATTGGDGRPRIESVARSIVRHQIGLYDTRDLGGTGTNFDEALGIALSMLGSAPAGPRHIMFLSDGEAPVSDGRLAELSQSGVRLRSFGIGARATCGKWASLNKMASATGESCQLVPNPAALAASLTGSQPDAVNSVTVTIGRVSVAATLDALGGWSASFTLGAGTYTATARAVLASGATVSTSRSFTVAPSADGPPRGTVAAGPGSLKATVVKVHKPKPHRAPLPATVTGRAGVLLKKFETTPKLKRARVVLEARPDAGASWKVVARDTVAKSGAFLLTWTPEKDMTRLRVRLKTHQGFAGSAAAVPPAAISGCKVTKREGGWSIRCSTTAKDDSRVRLLRNGKAIGFARVRDGSFSLRGGGPVGAHTIDITTGKRRLRLSL